MGSDVVVSSIRVAEVPPKPRNAESGAGRSVMAQSNYRRLCDIETAHATSHVRSEMDGGARGYGEGWTPPLKHGERAGADGVESATSHPTKNKHTMGMG